LGLYKEGKKTFMRWIFWIFIPIILFFSCKSDGKNKVRKQYIRSKYLVYAYLYDKQKEYKKAIHYYKKALQRINYKPLRQYIYLLLANDYYFLGDYDSSFVYLKKINIDEPHIVGKKLFLLGKNYVATKDYRLALSVFNEIDRAYKWYLNSSDRDEIILRKALIFLNLPSYKNSAKRFLCKILLGNYKTYIKKIISKTIYEFSVKKLSSDCLSAFLFYYNACPDGYEEGNNIREGFCAFFSRDYDKTLSLLSANNLYSKIILFRSYLKMKRYNKAKAILSSIKGFYRYYFEVKLCDLKNKQKVQCKYNVYKKYRHTFYIQKLLDEDIKELIRKKKFFQAIKYVKLLSYKGRRWFLLAKLYEKLGKRDKSLVYYRKVVSYNPFSYYGIVARMILYKRGIKNFRYRSIYEEAKKEYKRAIKRHKYMLLAFFKRNNVIFKVRKDATKKIFFALMKNNLYIPAIWFLRDRGKVIYPIASRLLLRRYSSYLAIRVAKMIGFKNNYWENVFFISRYWIFYPRAYRRLVKKLIKDYDIEDELLVYAIMRQESGYNEYAVSYRGAMGLMQVMNFVAKKAHKGKGLGYLDFFVPNYNIMAGLHYLSFLNKRFSNIVFIIGGYNAGYSAMRRFIKRYYKKLNDIFLFIEVIPYRETRNFIKSVLKNYFIYRAVYQY